ncbi:MAG TPA: pepsin/retropepsin-like aspartic protease family protein [Bryobacteraceae bacterium]|jgi:predicted aspartyl protease
MRKALLLLWCSSLAAADLDQLLDSHRFFELRRQLAQPGSESAETLFYRGVLECRFGHEDSGIAKLQEVLATNPSQAVARRSHEEMAEAFKRMGRYRESAEQLAGALRLTPKDDPEYAGNENDRLLMDSLSDVAPGTVEFGDAVTVRAIRNPLGSWNVPVTVNHVQGQWIFDTGANWSTVTESEARRMGLSVVETKAYVTGSTGAKNRMRLAFAQNLEFSGAHIHNVVLLVLADASLNIAPLHHYQITGILGIPVLRSLGSVGISKEGMVRMREGQNHAQGAPNFFFDGEDPVAEISHDGHLLQMFVDTGANATVLYPSFRNAMTGEETQKLHTKRERRAGAGGSIQRRAQQIPALRLDFLDKPVDLKKVSIEPEAPPNSHDDGVIGMDALSGGFRIDFDAMRLELD